MAATWTTISEADIRTVLAGRELEAYRNAAKYGTEVDPVAGITTNVVEYVRGYIAAYKRNSNSMGPAGTLPASMKEVALAIICWRIMGRSFGEVMDASGVRKATWEQAERTLRDIAEGKGPEIPVSDNPEDDDGPVYPMEYSNEATSEVAEMTRADQEGSAI
jgi:hypothetical protein